MKIALVSESPAVIRILHECLAHVAKGHRESWIAYDGPSALAKCQTETPDLILLDLALNHPDAIETTRKIVAQHLCPVLIVAENVSQNVSRVFDALGSGALGAVDLPHSSQKSDSQELINKINMIEQIKEKPRAAPIVAQPALPSVIHPVPSLIVIGASTGGPQALATILHELPGDFPAAIIIIQHVDARLADGLATWLAQQTRLPVTIAHEDDALQEGKIIVAGTNDHLVLGPDRLLHYTPHPIDCPYRPSVDAFFNSAVSHWPAKAIAVLLTGMGRDGAAGLLALRRLGWHTIAQDEATSIVYGMPRCAIELHAAVDVLPLEKIAAALLAHTLTPPAGQPRSAP